MKVILLSAPPRSGKDTAAREIIREAAELNLFGVVVHMAFNLKTATHAVYASFAGMTVPPAFDHFEDRKDENSGFFLGQTPRQAYIDFHDNWIKPTHGKTYIAGLCAKKLELAAKFGFVIIPDIGNEDEANVFREKFDTLAVRLNSGNEWDNRSGIVPDVIYDGDAKAFAARHLVV